MTTRTVNKNEKFRTGKLYNKVFGYCTVCIQLAYFMQISARMTEDHASLLALSALSNSVKCQRSRLCTVKCPQSQIPQMSDCIKRTVKLGMHKIIFCQANIVQTLPYEKISSIMIFFFFVQLYERMNVADALVTRSFEDGDVIIKQVCNIRGQRTYIKMRVFSRNHEELAPVQQSQKAYYQINQNIIIT